ncbi:hypothetical protein IG631_20521 [Alternaria alternata]|nr:hypothetical protein IG631_20521 [Alternaria alternata]
MSFSLRDRLALQIVCLYTRLKPIIGRRYFVQRRGGWSGSVHYDKCWLQLTRSTKSGCAAVTKQRACVVRIHLKKSAATIYRYWQHGCLNQDDKRVDMIHSNDKAFTPP